MTDKVNFGKTSWDKRETGGSSDDFLQLNKDGEYEVRIIGDSPFEFSCHWTTDGNGQNRRVKCAGHGCVLCKEGVKAQTRFLLEVLNRETGKCQVVEFGTQVFNQIVALRSNKHWGDPTTYDILIDRKKSRGPSDMYQVMAIGQKSPLSPDEAAAAAEFTKRMETVIEKVGRAATNDEILQKLGRAQADSQNDSWGEPETEKVENEEEDDTFDF